MEHQNKGLTVCQIQSDSFVCGTCQYFCSDVISLLAHKAQHAVGEDWYKCELCNLLCKQEELIDHYKTIHKVALLFTKNESATANCESLCSITLSQDGWPKAAENTINVANGFSIVNVQDVNQQEMAAPPPPPPPAAPLESNPVPSQDEVQTYHVEIQVENSTDIEAAPEEMEVNAELCEALNDKCKEANLIKITNDAFISENNCIFLLVTECSASKSRPYLRTWFVCLFCTYSTRMRGTFLKHMNQDHATDSLDEVVDTEKIITKSGVMQDNMPGVTFAKYVMTMEEYDQFVPEVRGKSNDSESKRVRRLEKQDIVGIYPCEECSKVFGRLRYLKRHLATHKKEKPHECSECNKRFKTLDLLRIHKKGVHNADKMYKCPQCDFKSDINSAIHAHRQEHPQGSIICDVCGKAYSDKSTLVKHMQVHDLKRPYACNVSGCMWRFKSEIMYRAHMRAHNTQGKFKCMYCGYVFRHKHHLQRHQSKLHGVEPVKPRPYGLVKEDDQVRDMVEIPADQLEIHEAAFVDKPIFVAMEPTGHGMEEEITYENVDLTLIQNGLVNVADCGVMFEQQEQGHL